MMSVFVPKHTRRSSMQVFDLKPRPRRRTAFRLVYSPPSPRSGGRLVVRVLLSWLSRPRWTERDARRIRKVLGYYDGESSYRYDARIRAGLDDVPFLEAMGVPDLTDRLEEILAAYKKQQGILVAQEREAQERRDRETHDRIKPLLRAIVARHEATAAARYKSEYHRRKMVTGLLDADPEYQGSLAEWNALPWQMRYPNSSPHFFRQEAYPKYEA